MLGRPTLRILESPACLWVAGRSAGGNRSFRQPGEAAPGPPRSGRGSALAAGGTGDGGRRGPCSFPLPRTLGLAWRIAGT